MNISKMSSEVLTVVCIFCGQEYLEVNGLDRRLQLLDFIKAIKKVDPAEEKFKYDEFQQSLLDTHNIGVCPSCWITVTNVMEASALQNNSQFIANQQLQTMMTLCKNHSSVGNHLLERLKDINRHVEKGKSSKLEPLRKLLEKAVPRFATAITRQTEALHQHALQPGTSSANPPGHLAICPPPPKPKTDTCGVPIDTDNTSSQPLRSTGIKRKSSADTGDRKETSWPKVQKTSEKQEFALKFREDLITRAYDRTEGLDEEQATQSLLIRYDKDVDKFYIRNIEILVDERRQGLGCSICDTWTVNTKNEDPELPNYAALERLLTNHVKINHVNVSK